MKRDRLKQIVKKTHDVLHAYRDELDIEIPLGLIVAALILKE